MFRDCDSNIGLRERRTGIVTLDELMQYIPVGVLYELAGLFKSSERDCREAMAKDGVRAGSTPVDESLRKRWLATFEKAATTPQFKNALPFGIGTIGRLVEALQKPETTIWEIGELLRDLERRISDELRQQIHFQIDPELVGLLAKPTPGWAVALAKYPATTDDITEASWCLALDRWTACVFHLMRVSEHGLHALAAEVGITNTVDLENWKNIIDQIEKKIREAEQAPKSPDKSAKLQRYSELASQLRYFKDAWRNHVSHARSSYDRYQARSVYTHVQDFMEKMAADV